MLQTVMIMFVVGVVDELVHFPEMLISKGFIRFRHSELIDRTKGPACVSQFGA
jgi:hypothetical protein